MAKHVRVNPVDLENARAAVAKMYLQGHLQSAIAARLGVSQQTISNDLAAIRRVWREQAIEDYTEIHDRELQKVNQLEVAAWTGWERSLRDGRDGDAKFLSIVVNALAHRLKLLGVDSPQQERMRAEALATYDDPITNEMRVKAIFERFILTQGDEPKDAPPQIC
jgi:hypothetical protein